MKFSLLKASSVNVTKFKGNFGFDHNLLKKFLIKNFIFYAVYDVTIGLAMLVF